MREIEHFAGSVSHKIKYDKNDILTKYSKPFVSSLDRLDSQIETSSNYENPQRSRISIEYIICPICNKKIILNKNITYFLL